LGSFSGNGSDDIVLSFSTAKGANDPDNHEPVVAEQIANSDIDVVFEATVQATEIEVEFCHDKGYLPMSFSAVMPTFSPPGGRKVALAKSSRR
jgi:hypothetical protein